MGETIRVNVDWINAWLIRNHMTKKDFSMKLGYSYAWWNVVTSKMENKIRRTTAMNMCRLFDIKWEDVTSEEMPTEPQTPTVTSNDDVQRFADILMRIDKRLEDIEKRIEKLEWLSR